MEPQIKIEGNTMTITVDLSARGTKSASGKSIVLASTHGNQAVTHEGTTIYVGLNIYKKA